MELKKTKNYLKKEAIIMLIFYYNKNRSNPKLLLIKYRHQNRLNKLIITINNKM